MIDTALVRAYLLDLQDRIVDAVQAEDGARFITDAWQRDPGGANEAPKAPAASAPGGGVPGVGRPGAGLEGDGRTRLLEGGHHVFQLLGQGANLLGICRGGRLQFANLLIEQICLLVQRFNFPVREWRLDHGDDPVEVAEDEISDGEPGNGHESSFSRVFE